MNPKRALLIFAIITTSLIFAYITLGRLGIIPTYQCGSTMSPGGPVSWCGWYKGQIAG